MTQKEYILAQFKAGKRFMDSNVWERTNRQVSAPSMKRIIHELRHAGEPILDIEIKPENGGNYYKEYFYGKPPKPEHPLLAVCRERLAEYRQKSPDCVEVGKIAAQVARLEAV